MQTYTHVSVTTYCNTYKDTRPHASSFVIGTAVINTHTYKDGRIQTYTRE